MLGRAQPVTGSVRSVVNETCTAGRDSRIPFRFSSPVTGPGDSVNYSRVAFEADLPRIEGRQCRAAGVGCQLVPTTDKGTPVAFYPFFSAFQNGIGDEQRNGGCAWTFGTHLRGANDFGRNAQYGPPLQSTYLAFGGHGATVQFFNDFRQVMPNPCPAGGNQQ